MSSFAKKQFLGNTYEFHHLAPSSHTVDLDAAGTARATLHVTYSIHCFTETFDSATHQEHHRYTHAGETRAFNLERYNCSIYLPSIVGGMARAKVYRALQNNYTYVALVPINGQQNPYSMFFTLKEVASPGTPTVKMYVQSAYLKPLTVAATAQSWRFGSLLGQVSGVFESASKKPRPKKKAP